MNPSTVSTVEPVVEQAAQINPWALTPPTDASTAWLDAAAPAVQPEHASGFHLTQIFDGSLPLESWINQGLGWV
ncbi:MAG: proline/glycine betaine ABC transporter permease ProW, partial [Janthinobacterium sp.]